MKKSIFLAVALLSLLTSCVRNNPNPTDSTSVTSETNKDADFPQTITLTTDNFSTYVATSSSSVEVDRDIIYYTHFIGADNCRFNGCTVTYTYSTSGADKGDGSSTVPLTISGDGEAKPFCRKESFGFYTFYLLSVKGQIVLEK